VVVATVGTSASCNILQHPSASLIGIHCKYWGSSGIHGIGIGIKVWSSGSTEACLCTMGLEKFPHVNKVVITLTLKEKGVRKDSTIMDCRPELVNERP
jgi:hypothetical protein